VHAQPLRPRPTQPSATPFCSDLLFPAFSRDVASRPSVAPPPSETTYPFRRSERSRSKKDPTGVNPIESGGA
jgi:hypothetical protein